MRTVRSEFMCLSVTKPLIMNRVNDVCAASLFAVVLHNIYGSFTRWHVLVGHTNNRSLYKHESEPLGENDPSKKKSHLSNKTCIVNVAESEASLVLHWDHEDTTVEIYVKTIEIYTTTETYVKTIEIYIIIEI